MIESLADQQPKQVAASEERLVSSEMQKLKSELSKFTEGLASTLQNLRSRNEEGLTSFIEETELEMLAGTVSELNGFDVYGDTNLEKTAEILQRTLRFCNALEMQGHRGMSEDFDSLQTLVRNVAHIAEQATAMEHVVREAAPNALEVLETLASLTERATEKAHYLNARLEAMAAYLT